MTEEILTVNEFISNPEYMRRMQVSKGYKSPYDCIVVLLSRKNYKEFRAYKTIITEKGEKVKRVAIKNIEQFIVKYETRGARNKEIWSNSAKKSHKSAINNITTSQAGLSNCYNFKGNCTKCVYNNYESLKNRCQTYNVLMTAEKYKYIIFNPEIQHQPSKEMYDYIVGRTEPIESIKRSPKRKAT